MTPEEKELIDIKLSNHFLGLHLAGIELPQYGYTLLVDKQLITSASREQYKGIRSKSFHDDFVNRITITEDGTVDAFGIQPINVYKPIEEIIKQEKEQGRNYDPQHLIKELNIIKNRNLRTNIQKKEWYIVDKTKLSDEFFDWIESIRKGWQFKIEYKPFELYKEQATAWLSQNHKFPNGGSEDDKLQYVILERKRMLDNSLYAVNKYGIIKDDQELMGQKLIESWEVQAFILYLLDCDLSVLLGKPRQIGSTTIIALAQIIKTMIRRNYYCKLVAQKGKKSEEIFEHKVKFPVENFVYYIKPSISNYNGSAIVFKYKESKGASTSSTSVFEVCAPSSDVVNAGTPSCTLLDEVGLNDLLDEIIDNGRPTQFWFNPATGKLEMRRQIFGWGTADASSPMFEVVYKAAKEEWYKRNYRYGLIPIFVNIFSKPGMDKATYDNEKIYYYSRKKQPGKPDPKIMFHQTYPLVEDDMWLLSDDTIVPTVYIKKQQEKLAKLYDKNPPKRGYFEPVYNTQIRRDDPLIPYRIIGAKFVPATKEDIEEDTPFASVYIMHDFEAGWTNRYYQGVDPIFASSGHSKMASGIWDASLKRFPAWYNGRTHDYRFCYLQSLLLNLHFSNKEGERMTGIKQLIEINVGGEYKNFCEDHKYGSTLVMNSMLPEQFQTSTVDYGVRKMGNNTKNIVTKLEELINNYGDNIAIEDFWAQARTFVKKSTKTGFSWGPSDLRINWDDILDMAVYAYMNADAHKHLKISHISEKSKEKNLNQRRKLVCNSSTNFNLVYQGATRQRMESNAA